MTEQQQDEAAAPGQPQGYALPDTEEQRDKERQEALERQGEIAKQGKVAGWTTEGEIEEPKAEAKSEE